MATPAQIATNRLNAQSLVIPGEDESALAELAAAYREQFQPVGPEEALLLEKIVQSDWIQRRMSRLETEVLNSLIAEQDPSEPNPLGAAFLRDCQRPNALQKIFRRREAASREWYRALKELRDRQSNRVALSPRPAPISRPVAVPETEPEPITPIPATHASACPPTQSDAPPVRTAPRIGFVFDASTPPALRL